MIEVILKEDVEHLGHRGDVVRVAPGFARNYLLPRKLALQVTEGNKRQIEHMKKVAAQRAAEEKAAAEQLAGRVTGVVCVIARRVGETETLYGSVTSADIAEVLAAQGIEVDRRRIQLADPIKTLGDHQVPVRLHRDVVATVTVQVVKEG
ncbi:MAG: 50S ribosomal protein L9 [Vicinamibacterales bacterium]|nr:50S ribosomal protein L9 [Vicinamibacterales bacterium]